jgi:Ca2+/H+ antiporter
MKCGLPFHERNVMSNKPHHRPHQNQRRASRTTRLLVATLIVAVFAFIVALELTGHIIVRGR